VTAETVSETVLSEPVVVDRSPELARNKTPLGGLPGLMGLIAKRRQLVISQDVLDRAERGNGAKCALAIVIKEQLGWDADISGETPTVNGQVISMDKEIIDLIGRFDRGEKVEPQTIWVQYNEFNA
jgi:hypothetical protein